MASQINLERHMFDPKWLDLIHHRDILNYLANLIQGRR